MNPPSENVGRAAATRRPGKRDVSPARGAVRGVIAVALAGAVALTLGVLTAYAQHWLPSELRSLANSAGDWALVAFLLALVAPTAGVAAASGAVSLGALLLGYVLASQAQHATSATSLIAFWGLAAVLGGPPLGLAAYWVRAQLPIQSGLGLGIMAGVLIGEGIYGLTYIADTTYPPYWIAEAAVGVALLATVTLRRPRRLHNIAVSLAATIVVAALFVAVYGHNLIAYV